VYFAKILAVCKPFPFATRQIYCKPARHCKKYYIYFSEVRKNWLVRPVRQPDGTYVHEHFAVTTDVLPQSLRSPAGYLLEASEKERKRGIKERKKGRKEERKDIRLDHPP